MILGDIAAPKDRGKYYAYFSIAFTTAGGTGPALGGWISDHLHWSVIFLWNFPFCVLAVVLRSPCCARLPRRERPHRLDFVGALLVMAASSSFMLALNLGGVRYPWLSSPVLALLGCALVLGGGFVVRLLTAAEPLIPIAILSDPAARLCDRGAFVRLGRDRQPQRLSADVSAKRARLVADFVGLEPDDPDGHAQCQRRPFQPARSAGCGTTNSCRCAFSSLASARWWRWRFRPATMTPEKFEIILFLIGIGFGPTAPLTQVALQNTVSMHDLGAGLGTMNFARTLIEHDPGRDFRRHRAGRGRQSARRATRWASSSWREHRLQTFTTCSSPPRLRWRSRNSCR